MHTHAHRHTHMHIKSSQYKVKEGLQNKQTNKKNT